MQAQVITKSTEKLPVMESKKFTEEERDQFTEYILKAVEEEHKGRYFNAIELYTKALKIDEESPMPMARRGICRARVDQNKAAADDIWEALHLKPKTVSDFATLGWIRATSPIEKFRDGVLAVSFAQRALRESETIEHYDVLAAGYAEMNNFERAKDTIEKGIKYFPDSPRIEVMRERLALYKKRKKFRENWDPIEKKKAD